MTDTLQITADLDLQAAEGDSHRRFQILAYSGGKLNVSGFSVPVVVDLTGLEAKSGLPILIDHKKSVEATLGIADEIINDGRTLALRGPITGKSPVSQQVIAQSDAGHNWQASIGAAVVEAEEIAAGSTVRVNGQVFSGPVIVARRSVLRETSVLPMGADSTTHVNLAASAANLLKGAAAMSFDLDARLQELGIDAATLTPEVKAAFELLHEESAKKETPAKAETQKTVEATETSMDIEASLKEQRTQFANLHRKIAEIQAKASGHPAIIAKAIEEDWSTDKVELEVIKATAAKTRPTSFVASQNADENTPQVLEAALCMTRKIKDVEKHYDDKILQAAHSKFRRGVGLQEMFLMAAAANGMPVSVGSRINTGNLREVLAYAFPQNIQAAFSTVSLPGILSNVANKELLEGYMEEDDAWRQIATVKSVSDFKTVTSYRMLDNMEYEQLGPAGEIKHGTVGQESYTRQADTYAKMFALTRTDMINDDLGAFDDLRSRIGRGAAIKLNKVFWTTFVNNSSFFTSGRTNYITGATTNLGTDGVGLGLGVTAFRKMTSPAADGSKKVNGAGGRPEILLVPPELEFTAEKLYVGGNLNTGTAAGEENIFRNKYRPVVAWQLSDSAYTGNSTTAWYLLNNPSFRAAVAVSFLNGQETPTVESADADFNTLGVQFRGYHDFGCDQAEYLCGVKSKGAS